MHTNAEKETIEYVVDAMTRAGLQVVRKDKMCLVGITKATCARISEELQVKRERLDGQSQTYLAAKDEEFKPFASGERIRVIQHLLDRLVASGESIPPDLQQDDAIIHTCRQKKLITALFPLHDDREKAELMQQWVKSIRIQPLDAVRTYFGDQASTMHLAHLHV